MKINLFPFLMIASLFTTACHSSQKSGSTASGASASTSSKHRLLDNNTFKLTAVADDSTYAYTAANAVKVGNGNSGVGPTMERRYLNALLGPEGQKISYERKGSCCSVKSDHGFMGYALLDRYEITYEGLEKPIILYLNMYDPGEIKAPKGFTYRQ